MRRLVLSALVVLLSAVAALEWQLYSRLPEQREPILADPEVSPDVPPVPRLDEQLRLETREEYASIIERPLFRPDRRPEPPEEASDGVDDEERIPLEALDLSAVLIAPGRASAWVREPSAAQARRVRIGDTLGGWRIQDIHADHIVLERQGETDQLPLRNYTKATTQQRPARPSPPALPRRPVSPFTPREADDR